MSEAEHIVVMGVSGTGKTTIGRLVARKLHRDFIEGDDLHPTANVAQMRAGVPLTDAERLPWLRRVRDAMSEAAADGRSTVVACSALRASYRDVLRTAEGRVRFVHLAVPRAVLEHRVEHREGHFMPASLLDSQLATLEPLGADEDGVEVPVSGRAGLTVRSVLAALG
ncbi:gluconokinase [Cellulomonas alba]|uniref:Gluconokinase n=1 Tax=Cellulomonas alba TaxID=3053467 RepID=A0ABT7SI01_9CELL|nr:gluconokinase [Cellulomonas alba]MDM7855182.1 gluconokinase [Cellulomonas alba]